MSAIDPYLDRVLPGDCLEVLAELPAGSVDLVFAGDTLARMVFLDNLEQQTIVSFTAVETNISLPPERFVFVVPEDADLVGTPASAGTPPETL